MTDDGLLIIEAKRHRTQEQNRFDAIQRLKALIQRALEKPNIRRATRPSYTAKAARMSDKKKHGEVKRTRRLAPKDWE
jgi:ribosome-associated protein